LSPRRTWLSTPRVAAESACWPAGETLVVAIGEFGRTPKINKNGGRDHWGHVFSFALAGAGISGGQVFGASDVAPAAVPSDRRGVN
jgi:uncharacterized protein (DUF1501 family)